MKISLSKCTLFLCFFTVYQLNPEKAFSQEKNVDYISNYKINKEVGKTTLDDYKIVPVPFTSVTVTDNFWSPRLQINHEVTVPHVFAMCESRIRNFKIAAGLESGHFQSDAPFDDSDVFKLLQGASYSLQYYVDPALDAQLDELISIIALAQEDDGYIYTKRTIDGDGSHPWIGNDRWVLTHDLSHELYNIGHLLEAASAHYTATGKTNFLDIAIKAADCVDRAFGWGKIENYPGHQEIEKGLVELFRVTGETKYLDLAKFFLDVRKNGPQYCQAHLPVVEQDKAVGHSVRAVYMYSGMADIAAIMGENAYITAIDKIWKDMVSSKTYVTGGIGASGGNEGFDEPYNLPNSSAYCETCASIGNVYFNQRMFLLHGESKYIDVMERTLYNALLSGISVSGDRFFYPNVLETTGRQRSPWFGCACCPTNVSRFIPSVPGYVYASRNDSLYVNLFMKNSARVKLGEDTVKINQDTEYPWNGKINISVELDKTKEFTLLLRLPGWAQDEAIPEDLYFFKDKLKENYTLKLNGENYTAIEKSGYLIINKTWSDGDKIEYDLPFPVRKILAKKEIVNDREKMTLQQGPIVYCAEWADNPTIDVLYQNYDSAMIVESAFYNDLFFGSNVLTTTLENEGASEKVSFIPYHLWANRGTGAMQVWLSFREPRILPDSLIVIKESLGDYATTNYVSSWEDIKGIYDLYDHQTSADKGPSAFGNWTADNSTIGKWNWVQYNLHKEYTIGSTDIYWWDDGQGLTLPDECYLSFFNKVSKKFEEIPNTRRSGTNEIKFNTYNKIVFGPIQTDAIRLNFKGDKKAQGILEWMIYKTDPLNSTNNYPIKELNFSISPNPVVDKCMIRSTVNGIVNLKVYSLKGNLVLTKSFENQTEIYKGELGKENCYIFQFLNEAGNQFHKVMVK